MQTTVYKNMTDKTVVIAGHLPIHPLDTFLGPIDNQEIKFLIQKDVLKHLTQFDSIESETKEERPVVPNKTLWDVI